MVQVHQRAVAARHDHPAWFPMVQDLFGASDASLLNGPSFRGAITKSQFGSLHFSTVSSSSEFTNRTARHIADDRRGMHTLVAVKSGSVTIKQNSRECVVTAGSFVLFDCDSPMAWAHHEPTEMFNVLTPSHMLEARMRNLSTHLARPFSSKSGTWQVAWTFLESLNSQLRDIPELAAYRYSQSVMDVISLALETSEDDAPMMSSAIRLPLYRRSMAFIRSNLSDPDLGPAKVADAMGISVRYLHRIFQDSGESVCGFIKNARLDACHADLGEASRIGDSIAETAYRHGFRSPSFFATAFRARFDMSARERRREALGRLIASKQ